MKFSTLLFSLVCATAVSLSAQGIGDVSLADAERVTASASVKTVTEGIVPIPDCFPCSEDNDPYSEGPADYPPIPFPKPPGLPKCYPICNLDETVVAAEQALIVPIPDCFPCSEDNDPYSEGPADYPPIPFPKPPGLPKCYPICNLDETVAAAEQALIVPIPDCFPCSEDNDPYSEGPADYPPIPFPKPPGLPKCYPICNLDETVAAAEQALIVPIPDCFPCSEDNDPYSEGPADYPPIPFPKPPGLPKCYPICNLDETVAAAEQALIVPIPDCFPCSEDNDPYSEGPADYPPIPFPKPPGLPKCYPICNLEGDSGTSLTPLGLVPSLTAPEASAPVLFEVETASVFAPAIRRSRHGLA